jgi:hypothetical protein
VPFTVRELDISGTDLLKINVPPRYIALLLKEFLSHLAINPRENKKERLLFLAPIFLKKIQENEP